ncbi:MAG: bifunctional glutamate N-acetyltransferase/amino-acid acetyltransferase ArgJ [Deltaproteobacteria bacterium]|nr:bifunctional glutamate N-acetyltransferase/amino-acid acetyltransferase ArgJ [Deltaproteobacteria bacterium]
MEKEYCMGFKAAGLPAGIKKNGDKDLGVIISESSANAAGVFTTNKVQAAPVVLDKERIKPGICQAVIVNSGNANCCTGEQGMRDAKAMAKGAAKEFGISEEMVLVASTGVIGESLPIEKIKDSMPDLVKSARPDGFQDFAEAILTTDTVPKIIVREGELGGEMFKVMGIAKGAGMIHPNMATLLGFICTDVQANSKVLSEALKQANQKSFNRITVDGDTSTNDTVLIMANGMSGVEINNAEGQNIFQDILDEVMVSLSRMLVKDAEGATKLVEITVKGAKSDTDARAIAETIAGSSLVKTALFGEDANWGRILAAAGRAGVALKPEKAEIYFNNVLMVKEGKGCGPEAEAQATRVLRESEFSIFLHLHLGNGDASVLTCDLSIDYVKINADYRS